MDLSNENFCENMYISPDSSPDASPYKNSSPEKEIEINTININGEEININKLPKFSRVIFRHPDIPLQEKEKFYSLFIVEYINSYSYRVINDNKFIYFFDNKYYGIFDDYHQEDDGRITYFRIKTDEELVRVPTIPVCYRFSESQRDEDKFSKAYLDDIYGKPSSDCRVPTMPACYRVDQDKEEEDKFLKTYIKRLKNKNNVDDKMEVEDLSPPNNHLKK